MDCRVDCRQKRARSDQMRTPRTYAIATLVAGSGLLSLARCGLGPGPTSSPTPEPTAFPLKVSPNKRYVTDQNNVPFLILGDSPHSLAVNVSLRDAATYFSIRRSLGFNCAWIQLLCVAY